MLLISSSLLLVRCADDDSYISYPEQEMIDFDPNIPIAELSAEQLHTYMEAQQRFGQYVKFDGQAYRTKCTDPSGVGLSTRVYNHFASMMQQTNDQISFYTFKEVRRGQFAPIAVSADEYMRRVKATGRHASELCLRSIPTQKTRKESDWGFDYPWYLNGNYNGSHGSGNNSGNTTPPGGRDGFDLHWSGIHSVYISNGCLQGIESTQWFLGIVGGVVGEYFGGGKGATIGAAAGVAIGEGAGALAQDFPNGIVASVWCPPVGPPMVIGVSGQ